jgi:hypothetical protein
VTILRFRPGLGFNPGFVSGSLPIPAGACRLEAGNSLYFQPAALARVADAVPAHSLHLARAPFSEEAPLQDRFLAVLAERLPAEVTSIGLHLGGPFRADLGYFGLGTAFVRTPEAERRSARLSEGLARLGRPILLENADLYPYDLAGALGALDWSNRLCRDHGSRLILDLAHLLVAAHNLGVDVRVLLGRIDLDLVAVVHLSGIVRGRDGALHDGHTEAIAPEVWQLLEEILPLLPDDVDVVLEHSDPVWAGRAELFLADWGRLCALSARPHEPPARPSIDREAAALGYMANVVVPQHFPALVAALGRRDLALLVREWGREFLDRVKRSPGTISVLLSRDDFWPEQNLVDPIADFAAHADELSRA